MVRREVNVSIVALLAVLLAGIGCGGNSSSKTGSKPAATVSVTPTNAQVLQGGQANFSAAVSNPAGSGVTWSIQEGESGGSITADGVYTAPYKQGTYHLIATSVADNTKSGYAFITVPALEIQLSPSSAELPITTAQYFYATVTGTVNAGLNWSVQEGASGGTIGGTGNYVLYVAPNTPGTFHIVAASVADSTRKAIAAINVTPPILTVTPDLASVAMTGTLQFAATIDGLSDQSVNWSVDEGPAGGVIDSNGLYAAPSTEGVFHITAVSAIDSTISGKAAVTVGAHGFKAVGSLQTARAYSTATVLQDGRVLVTGGCGPQCGASAALATAELFDPVQNTFSTTGSMHSPRLGQTATLLKDGKVLIAGGFDTTGFAVGTAELYDPSSGTFTSTGNLSTTRAWHSATLLDDGKVLIAGGITDLGHADQDVLASAEIYDPQSGTFAVTGGLSMPRWRSKAALLSNGKAIVTGGFVYASTVRGSQWSAEFYDPSTAGFGSKVFMDTPGGDAAAVLLADGNYFVSGGMDMDETGYPGDIWVSWRTDVFDLVSGQFRLGPSMQTERYLHTAVRLQDGRVLLAGGYNYSNEELSTAELYDPSTETVNSTGGLQIGLVAHSAVLLQDGRVLVLGGISNGEAVSLAEVFE